MGREASGGILQAKERKLALDVNMIIVFNIINNTINKINITINFLKNND